MICRRKFPWFLKKGFFGRPSDEVPSERRPVSLEKPFSKPLGVITSIDDKFKLWYNTRVKRKMENFFNWLFLFCVRKKLVFSNGL